MDSESPPPAKRQLAGSADRLIRAVLNSPFIGDIFPHPAFASSPLNCPWYLSRFPHPVKSLALSLLAAVVAIAAPAQSPVSPEVHPDGRVTFRLNAPDATA